MRRKQHVALRLDPTLLALARRAATRSEQTLTGWLEMAIRRQLEREGPTVQCAVCGRPLDPASAVFLGFGRRHDGKPGPGWVLALCPASPEETNAGVGSRCAAEARRRTPDLMPATYEEWLGV